MIQFEHVAQTSNWPLPFPLKGLKWTKVHPGSTFLYTFYMNNMKEIQDVCVCVKYSITGKYMAAKFGEAEYRRHICKGDQLPKFDPLGSWRLAPTCLL